MIIQYKQKDYHDNDWLNIFWYFLNETWYEKWWEIMCD